MIIYNLTLDIIADMFEGILAKIFGTKPAATDKNAVVKPEADADVKAKVPPPQPPPPPTGVPVSQPPSSEAAVAAGGQKGGSRRRRRRSCGKSKKGGAYSGMGFGRVGGKSHRRRRSKKRNTHKRRK